MILIYISVCGIWTNNPTYSLQKQVTAAAVQAQFRERYEINTSLGGIRHVEHGWIKGPLYSSGYYNTLPSVIGLTVKVETCSLGKKKPLFATTRMFYVMFEGPATNRCYSSVPSSIRPPIYSAG